MACGTMTTTTALRDRRNDQTVSAAERVFGITELLELILLSLPCDPEYKHVELAGMRTLLLGRRTCRAWHNLLNNSTPLRRRLYLCPAESEPSTAAADPECNPWIYHPFLGTRHSIRTNPFSSGHALSHDPERWSFSFEITREKAQGLPCAASWRRMLATDPPLTECWFPHVSRDTLRVWRPLLARRQKGTKVKESAQPIRLHCAEGITLGMIADSVNEMFDMHVDDADGQVVLILHDAEPGRSSR